MEFASWFKSKFGKKAFVIICFVLLLLIITCMYYGIGIKTPLVEIEAKETNKDTAIKEVVNGDQINNMNGDVLKDNSTKNVYSNSSDSLNQENKNK